MNNRVSLFTVHWDAPSVCKPRPGSNSEVVTKAAEARREGQREREREDGGERKRKGGLRGLNRKQAQEMAQNEGRNKSERCQVWKEFSHDLQANIGR